MKNGGKLSGLWIKPEILYDANLTPVQKMIIGMTMSFSQGARLSNSRWSEILGIDRRNVIYNIQSLRRKGYLVDVGPDKQHRILRVGGDKLSLLSSDKTPPVELESGGESSLGSDKTPPEVVIKRHPSGGESSPIDKRVNNKYKFSKDARRLAETLLDLIVERKKDFRDGRLDRREKTLERWSAEIDRMIRFDGRLPERVEAVIRWAQADGGNGNGWQGWQNNVLSGKKLRDKFDRLELEMQGVRNAGTGNNQASAEPYIR